MRKIQIFSRFFIGALFFLQFLTSCKTTSLSIEVLKPAEIALPSKIQTIALVNRSIPDKRDRAHNIIEGVISGEEPFVDRQASEQCISGANNGLHDSPRLKCIIANVILRGTGTREFPESLDWVTIENICKQNNADAIAVLETFDSNNRYSSSSRQVTKEEKNQKITYTEYTASLHVNIESGWRIYFPEEKRIIDQSVFNDYRDWSQSSDALKKAEAALPKLHDAVPEAGYYAGQRYAVRISPRWIWVSRMYFHKANDDFKKATRFVKAKDWKSASEIWQRYTNSNEKKIAGFACYNMALAAEMDGNLEEALDWAKKSYTIYNESKGKYYMNIIQRRINDQLKLKEQME